MNTLLIAGAALMVASLWNGKNLRAVMTMTGAGWHNLHPEVKTRAIRVLERAAAEFAHDGLMVGIFEGWRSVDTQRNKIATGDSFVSNPLSSYHSWGLAVDFVFLHGPGLWTWEPTGDEVIDRALWERLGLIIESEGFEWGGRWKTFDGPHAQLPLMRSAQLIEKYSAPEAYITWA
jgi:hypothetical protein